MPHKTFWARAVFHLIFAQPLAPQRSGLRTGKDVPIFFISQTGSVEISNFLKIKFLPTKTLTAVSTGLLSVLFLDQRSSLHNSPGPKA